MSDIVTVDYLLSVLQKASEHGYGSAKIKCVDGYLHTDEITFSPEEIKFRGYLFNYPPTDRVREFQKDIDKAVRKYYGLEDIDG